MTADAHYTRPKIILIGDSLTQTSFCGWGGRLADVYQRRADVINRGFSGFNTKFYLHMPMENLPSDKAMAIIFFGANDAALKDIDPHHHVSVEDYRDNLRTLIDRVKSKYPQCDNNILLITPPPVVHEQRLSYQVERYGDKATGVLERTLDNTAMYAQACRSVAEDMKLPCLNLFDAMQQESNWQRFFYDGLHFSPDGHIFVAEALLQVIADQLPEWKVEADTLTGQWANSGSKCAGLPSGGPYHDEIDHKDPQKAFEKHFA